MDSRLLDIHPDKMTTMERYLILKLRDDEVIISELKEEIAKGTEVNGERLNRLLKMEGIVTQMILEAQTERSLQRHLMDLSGLVKRGT